MNPLMMLVSLSALAARGIRIAIPREEYLAAASLLLTYLRERLGMRVSRITFSMLSDQDMVKACVESVLYPEMDNMKMDNMPANLRTEVGDEVSNYEREHHKHASSYPLNDWDFFHASHTHSDRRGMRINREQRQSRRNRQRERESLMRGITAYDALSVKEDRLEKSFDYVQAECGR